MVDVGALEQQVFGNVDVVDVRGIDDGCASVVVSLLNQRGVAGQNRSVEGRVTLHAVKNKKIKNKQKT